MTGRRVFAATSLFVASTLARGADPNSVPVKGWIEVRTKNLRIVSNASESRIRDIALLLEAFRGFLKASTKGLALEGGADDTIFVFKDDASFDPFKSAPDAEGLQMMGFFADTAEKRLIALNATPRQPIEHARSFRAFRSPYETVLHEYTHAVVRRSFPGLPVWLDEGLAVYFSTAWINGKQASIGQPSPAILGVLRGGLPMSLPALDMLPSFHALDPRRVAPAYATSWATVHYMLVGQKDRYRQFLRFLEEARRGSMAAGAFDRAFGTSLPGLEAEVRAYVLRGEYSYLRYPLEALEVGEPSSSTPISPESMRLALADLMVQTRKARFDVAQALVAPLADEATHRAGVLGIRGLMEERSEHPTDAERLYRSALELTPADPVLRFRLARVLIATGDRPPQALVDPPRDPDPRMSEARALLESVLLDRPDLDGAYPYFGLTYLGEPGDRSRGRALLESAEKFRRSRPDLFVPLGAMYLWDGDRAKALGLLPGAPSPNGAQAATDLRWIIVERDRREANGIGESGGREAQAAWIRARIEATPDPAIADHLRTWLTSMEPEPSGEPVRTVNPEGGDR